jgi:hypothetical protein
MNCVLTGEGAIDNRSSNDLLSELLLSVKELVPVALKCHRVCTNATSLHPLQYVFVVSH